MIRNTSSPAAGHPPHAPHGAPATRPARRIAQGTCLRRAKTRLHQRLTMYRTVADFTYDLEVWVAPDGTLRYVSPSCLRVTGFTPEQAIADPNFFARIIVAEDLPDWRRQMTAGHDTTIASMDFRIRTANGEVVWLAQETTRVFDPIGRYLGLRLSLRDVTDRVRTQASLDQARQHLEERVRARTRELEHSRERYRLLSGYLQDSIEKERTRIAREIHDVLGQDLTALNMGLHRLEKTFAPDDPRLTQARDLRDLVAATLSTVRRISRELRPPMLDELGFAEAVAWRARTFAEATGLSVDCKTGPIPPLPPDVSTALYRVLQECLTNSARHSGANRLRVRVQAGRSRIALSVTDNGCGLDPAQAESPTSLGLIGMGERIRQVGGSLDIQRPVRGGTRILVRVPLSPTKESPCDF